MPASTLRLHRARGSLWARAPRPPQPPLHATARELLLLLGALAALTLGVRALVLGVQDLLTPDPVAMPVPAPHSRTLAQPMLINVAIDDSGSMADSDPEDRRWVDVAALGRWLAKYERPDDLVVVTRFTESAVHGPVVSARRLNTDPRTLAPAPPADGTAFMPVVRSADEVFGATHGPYHRIVILLTDGHAPDAGAAIARLPSVADRVFVVALDRGDSWDQAKAPWERAGFPVTKLRNTAPNEIGAAMARAIMAATGEREA